MLGDHLLIRIAMSLAKQVQAILSLQVLVRRDPSFVHRSYSEEHWFYNHALSSVTLVLKPYTDRGRSGIEIDKPLFLTAPLAPFTAATGEEDLHPCPGATPNEKYGNEQSSASDSEFALRTVMMMTEVSN